MFFLQLGFVNFLIILLSTIVSVDQFLSYGADGRQAAGHSGGEKLQNSQNYYRAFHYPSVVVICNLI